MSLPPGIIIWGFQCPFRRACLPIRASEPGKLGGVVLVASKAKANVRKGERVDSPTGMGGGNLVARRKIALVAFAFSGMAALIYEVLWSRELSLIFGSTVYAVSMMLAAFMSGLSLGAIVGGRWADRSKNLFAMFGFLELGIAIFGLLTIPLVQALPTLYFFVYDTLRPSFFLFFIIQLLLSYIIMLIPTTFMGATFPVVAKINTVSLEELGNDVGDAYSVNTIGSIFGSLGAGFLLIPLIGVKATTFVAAGLNLSVASLMIVTSRSTEGKRWFSMGAMVLVLAVLFGLFTQQASYAHNFYRIGDFKSYDEYRTFRDSLQPLFFADDVHGRIAVLEEPNGNRFLQNSGKIEGANGAFDKQTTSLLALLPIASAENPKSMLVIGLGTGFTSLAALGTPMESVDTVEINKSVLQASKLFVGDAIESDARATIYTNDARNFLYTTGKKYDVITSEPSYPLSTHVSHLFTKEFYELVEKHLNDGGAYCQWIPRYMLKDEDTLMMLKTFQMVFPQTYAWGSNIGENEAVDVMLVGLKGERTLDPEAVDKVVRSGMKGAEGFEFAIFGDPAQIAETVKAASIPINTDDRPLLEFRTPRNQIEFFGKDERKAFR